MPKVKKKIQFSPRDKMWINTTFLHFFGKILECLKTIPGTILGKLNQ